MVLYGNGIVSVRDEVRMSIAAYSTLYEVFKPHIVSRFKQNIMCSCIMYVFSNVTVILNRVALHSACEKHSRPNKEILILSTRHICHYIKARYY